MSQATGSSLESFLAALQPIAILLLLLGPAARDAAAQEPKPAPAPPAAATPATLTPSGPGTTVVVTPSIDNQEQMGQVFDEFFKVGLDLEKPLAVHGFTLK